MLIELKQVFSLFLKIAREGLSRIMNGNLSPPPKKKED